MPLPSAMTARVFGNDRLAARELAANVAVTAEIWVA
jgi:hypothetical protein